MESSEIRIDLDNLRNRICNLFKEFIEKMDSEQLYDFHIIITKLNKISLYLDE